MKRSIVYAALAAPLAFAACAEPPAASSTIYLRTAQGILPVVPEVRGDGWVQIADDILVREDELARNTIAPEDLEQALAAPPSDALFAAVRAVGSARWPGGQVGFQLDAGLNATQRQRIQDAIDHWEASTPFRFVERTSGDRIQFRTGPDADSVCSSPVGRQGGAQPLDVESCPVGTLIHEIGHAVGFFHEQSRSDRDTYVTINWDNITDPDRVHNFDKFLPDRDGLDVGPYDYGSIMHYPRDSFGTDTVVPTQPGAVIGQRDGLSLRDRYAAIALVRGTNLYGPGGPRVTLYRDPGFAGTSQAFGPGQYAAGATLTPDLMQVIGNDTASSIVVPPGLIARLCVGNGEPDYDGCSTFTDDVAQLPTSIDNRASYLKVSRAVTAYRDANLGGVAQTFGIGTYRADQGQLATVGNDQITSLLVPPGLVVELCTSETSGTCQTFEGTVNNVGTLLDNKASLVRVRAAVTLFQEARLWGNRKSFTTGTYTDAAFAPVANNAVSSLVVGEGLQAVLCDGAGATGACATFRGDVVFVGPDLNDRASYLRVEANTAP